MYRSSSSSDPLVLLALFCSKGALWWKSLCFSHGGSSSTWRDVQHFGLDGKRSVHIFSSTLTSFGAKLFNGQPVRIMFGKSRCERQAGAEDNDDRNKLNLQIYNVKYHNLASQHNAWETSAVRPF